MRSERADHDAHLPLGKDRRRVLEERRQGGTGADVAAGSQRQDPGVGGSTGSLLIEVRRESGRPADAGERIELALPVGDRQDLKVGDRRPQRARGGRREGAIHEHSACERFAQLDLAAPIRQIKAAAGAVALDRLHRDDHGRRGVDDLRLREPGLDWLSGPEVDPDRDLGRGLRQRRVQIQQEPLHRIWRHGRRGEEPGRKSAADAADDDEGGR